jgi:hypothetical protein
MKTSNIVTRAQRLSKLRSKLYKSDAYRIVIGHLAAKKLLLLDAKLPRPTRKMSVADALLVGSRIEPRVLEVLPAAILRFPSIFIDIGKAPKDLCQVLQLLTSGKPISGEWRGIDIRRIAFWLNLPLSDGRSVPFKDRRVVKSFRLSPNTIKKIEELALLQGITHSEVIDRLLQPEATESASATFKN